MSISVERNGKRGAVSPENHRSKDGTVSAWGYTTSMGAVINNASRTWNRLVSSSLTMVLLPYIRASAKRP